MTRDELIAQLCRDLNQAHDELMRAQGITDPSTLDWPEWTPQANSIREAESMLCRRLAKTNQWTMYPEPKSKVTLSGRPPELPEDIGAPAPVDPATGMHRDYWVLSEEERAKGFVRPVRLKYVHKACGVVTTMNRMIAETYARDPKFYGATFCANCRTHFPVVEFVWDGTNEPVGS